MHELAAGLWHWQAPHPDWRPTEPWDQMVSSCASDDGERLLLFDPLAPPGGIEELAADRETAIVLTCPWHERDTHSLVERLGAPVYAPPPDTAEDLMHKFGITVEEAHVYHADAPAAAVRDGLSVYWRPGCGPSRPVRIGCRVLRE